MKQGFSRIGMALFVYLLIISFSGTFFYGILIGVVPDISKIKWLSYLINNLFKWGLGFPVFLHMIKKVPQIEIKKRTLKVREYLVYIAVSFGVVFVGEKIGSAVIYFICWASKSNYDSIVLDIIEGNIIWINIIVTALVTPFFEELMFRKLLINRLIPYGEKIAVFLSALIFGIMHGNPEQIFYAFGMGIVLGYIYVKSGKIRYTVAIHIFFNLQSVIIMKLSESNRYLTGINVYGYIITGIAIIGLVILVLFRNKIKFQPGGIMIPKEKFNDTVFLNKGMILFLIFCIFLIVISTLDIILIT